MTNYSIFNNNALDNILNQNGFVYTGRLDHALVDRLLNIDNELNIPDSVGCDFNVGMNTEEYSLRSRMQNILFEILKPYFENILPEYEFFSATLINKTPTKKFLITAHQDFTYTDEPDEPSFMCWIPLVDTDTNNGVIGFIPKSHLFYDYKRAFPFPFDISPVVKNEYDLMKYLEFKPMKAGEIVYFFNKSIHGSFANYTSDTRYALNISFIKKNSKGFVYIRNPKNKYEFFKYSADKNFLIKCNNSKIQEMYKDGNIEIKDYELLSVEPFGNYDTSWESVREKLRKFDVNVQDKNIELLNRFKTETKKEKVKTFIYTAFKKITNR